MPVRPELDGPAQLRWSLADAPGPQGQLFERVRREVGRGEFRGMEFLEVEAKRLLNEAVLVDPQTGLQAESDEQVKLIGSRNQIEAVAANMAKRAPAFADP